MASPARPLPPPPSDPVRGPFADLYRVIPNPTPWGIPEIDAVPLVQDPWHAWMEDHPEELARYAGERVLIHPLRGIVAHGTIEDVYDAAHRLPDAERDEVLISAVPA